MWRMILFLALLAAGAFGLSWLLDHPGELSIVWLGQRVETSVFVALGALLLTLIVLIFAWSLLRTLWRSPRLFGRASRARKRRKGMEALSAGMIAASAGDNRAAARAARDAARHVPDEPLRLLLEAQVAQMAGNEAQAAQVFQQMAARPDMKLLGLRGLHVEARRNNDADAAHHFAQEAHRLAPVAWAGQALVEHHAAQGDWRAALDTVEANLRSKAIDAATAQRQRAVLETAIAQEQQATDPDGALKLARSAAKRAPDLVPAVALAARLAAKRGDMKSASRLIEGSWAKIPHPELSNAYLDVRPGDSNADRRARAKNLAKRAPDHPESALMLARAALAVRDFDGARAAMAPLVAPGSRPSVRACLMMAEIADEETGDPGAVREWLARGSRAPRDATWIADGASAAEWAPVSPVSGKLDAFEWLVPPDPAGTAATIAADEAFALRRPEPEPMLIESALVAVEAPPAVAAPSPMIQPQPVIFPLPASPDDPGPKKPVAQDTRHY